MVWIVNATILDAVSINGARIRPLMGRAGTRKQRSDVIQTNHHYLPTPKTGFFVNDHDSLGCIECLMFFMVGRADGMYIYIHTYINSVIINKSNRGLEHCSGAKTASKSFCRRCFDTHHMHSNLSRVPKSKSPEAYNMDRHGTVDARNPAPPKGWLKTYE